MKVFTTVEISKEDLDNLNKNGDEGEISKTKARARERIIDLFIELVEADIPVQLKFTNMPPRPYPGFRPASEI